MGEEGVQVWGGGASGKSKLLHQMILPPVPPMQALPCLLRLFPLSSSTFLPKTSIFNHDMAPSADWREWNCAGLMSLVLSVCGKCSSMELAMDEIRV
jgi:hypothetical protein